MKIIPKGQRELLLEFDSSEETDMFEEWYWNREAEWLEFIEDRKLYVEEKRMEVRLMEMITFLESCILGESSVSDIDKFIEAWHCDMTITLQLHEYLGMTWDEYSQWTTKPSTLPLILAAKKRNLKFNVNKEKG